MLSRIFSILVIKNLLNAFTSSKRDPEGSLVFSFQFMRSLITSNSLLLIIFAVIHFVIIIYLLTLLNKIGNFISCSTQHLSFDLNFILSPKSF